MRDELLPGVVPVPGVERDPLQGSPTAYVVVDRSLDIAAIADIGPYTFPLVLRKSPLFGQYSMRRVKIQIRMRWHSTLCCAIALHSRVVRDTQKDADNNKVGKNRATAIAQEWERNTCQRQELHIACCDNQSLNSENRGQARRQ